MFDIGHRWCGPGRIVCPRALMHRETRKGAVPSLSRRIYPSRGRIYPKSRPKAQQPMCFISHLVPIPIPLFIVNMPI